MFHNIIGFNLWKTAFKNFQYNKYTFLNNKTNYIQNWKFKAKGYTWIIDLKSDVEGLINKTPVPENDLGFNKALKPKMNIDKISFYSWNFKIDWKKLHAQTF